MRRRWLWGILVLGLVGSSLAERIWPSMIDINERYDLTNVNEMDAAKLEDIIAMLILRPFHYLTSVLLFIFTFLLLSYLFKRTIYECKVARMLKKIPYEPLILMILGIGIYIKVILFFPLLTLILTLIVLCYEGIIYLNRRKKEVVFIREG